MTLLLFYSYLWPYYYYFIEGLSSKPPAVSEPKLWRKSTFHIKRVTGGSKREKIATGSGSSLTSLETTRHTDEQEHLQDSQGDQSNLFFNCKYSRSPLIHLSFIQLSHLYIVLLWSKKVLNLKAKILILSLYIIF